MHAFPSQKEVAIGSEQVVGHQRGGMGSEEYLARLR
jgi:hypothetical protein